MDKVMSTTSCATTTTTDQQNVSISINGQSRVPPGFRFHPTEEELLQYYLRKKVGSQKIDLDVIVEVDLNKLEPWDIQEKCKIGSTPQNEWYFFSHKDKKYPTGTRTNRATMAGFWKATGRDKVIYGSGKRIGMRKTLVFYKGRAPHGQKSDWIMHEYRLIEDYRSTSATAAVNHETNIIAAVAAGDNSAAQEEGWVVCKIFKKKHYPNKLSSSSAAAATAAARNGILMSNGNNSPNNCSTMMTKNSIPTELTESYLSSDQDHDENHEGALEQIFQHINSKPSLPTKYSNGIIMDDVVVFNNNNREDHEDDEEEEDDNLINHGFHKSTSFDDNFTSSMRLPNLESPNTNTNVGGNLGYDHNSYNHHLNVVELSHGSDKFGKEGSGVDDQLQQGSYTMGAADGFSDWGTIDQLLATNLISSHQHQHHHIFNQYNKQQQQSLLSDHHQNLHHNLSSGYNTTTSALTAAYTLDHHQYHHHHHRRGDDDDNNQQSTTSSYFLQQQPVNHDSFLSSVSEIDHLWNLVSRSNHVMSTTQPTAAAAAASSSDVLM